MDTKNSRTKSPQSFEDMFSPSNVVEDLHSKKDNLKNTLRGKRCFACLEQNGFSPQLPSTDTTDVSPTSAYLPREPPAKSIVNMNDNTRLFSPCHYMTSQFHHEEGQTIDNASVLLQKLAHLMKDEDLSDITIILGDKTYHAHKLVLCCSSEVFKIMLTSDSWSDHGKRTIVLQEETECMDVFEDFLCYLYTAVIHLAQSTVLPVLMLADKYNVLDLQVLCIDYMQSHLVSTVCHNQAVDWHQYALLCHHTKLAQDCERFILWNFHKVSSSKLFSTMDITVLEHFLKSSDLIIPDEFTLFQILGKWLRHSAEEIVEMDVPMEEIDLPQVRVETEEALQLLSLIRFPMMPPQHLIQLQEEPLAELYQEFFISQIELAMKMHYCGLGERKYLIPSGRDYLVKPRSYTNEMWSTNLVIENFSTLPKYNIQPLVFSSPISGAENDENRSWDWHLDLYPKGIEYGKCIMINLFRKLEVPGATNDIVRVVLKTTQQRNHRRVQACVLVWGVQDNIEYVRRVMTRNCFFDDADLAYNLDDIVPYDMINEITGTSGSPFLVGSSSDTFKIAVIIKPL